MNAQLAVDIFKNLIMFSIYVCAPFLVVMLVVGLVTSLLQSITSIQEPTLTFAPKLIALAALCIAIGPWVLRSLSEFAIRMITQMATMGS
ncbi:flagellar biosynthetic protein FliQ [Nibricoccus sp. IMCC34717]|uniref:flagellar biosynthetic protein FliQ n=1 Tax=Nibricoccus sp. IMCC34717 TaxID=3034021 RepID=UPI00384B1684